MLTSKSRAAKTEPKAKLAEEWMPKRDPQTGNIVASGRLWDFTEKIAQSRREGKNRRDGATVSTRVLRLTDAIARGLFAEDGEVGGIEEGASGKKRGKGKRRLSLGASRPHL